MPINFIAISEPWHVIEILWFTEMYIHKFQPSKHIVARNDSIYPEAPRLLSFYTPDFNKFCSRIGNCVLGPIQPSIVVSNQITSHLDKVICMAEFQAYNVPGAHQGSKTPFVLSMARRLP